MIRRSFLTLTGSLLASLAGGTLLWAGAAAAASDAPSGVPMAAEAPFVAEAMRELPKRFPSPDAAVKAGYLRFTDEDKTGAISYANRQWTSADAEHPSQLWYDARGRLIGADYSAPYDAGGPPHLFGAEPARWQRFGAHVHYGVAKPDGSTTYGAVGAKRLVAAGASADSPTAAGLVAANVVQNAADVRFVFAFPAIWDLSLWVVPNPSGAFAEANPAVKAVDGKDSM